MSVQLASSFTHYVYDSHYTLLIWNVAPQVAAALAHAIVEFTNEVKFKLDGEKKRNVTIKDEAITPSTCL